jgi:hypothetical protein
MGGAPEGAMRVASQIWQVVFASQTLQVFCLAFRKKAQYVVVNASKVVHSFSTTRFDDIVNIFATFVIKFISLKSLTQSNISILQSAPTLMLQITSII